jgi:hypothetical protein
VSPSIEDGQPAPALHFGDPRVIALLACLCSFQHLFAGLTNRTPRRGRPPKNWTTIDRDYETLRRNLQTLLNDLGITTKATATSTTNCRSRLATL